jgi:hypothetical protein
MQTEVDPRKFTNTDPIQISQVSSYSDR